jgi:hypothetical protein
MKLMRRVRTGLVVAAVVAVGVAAAVDVLSQQQTPEAVPSRALVGALREAGIRGTLTYSDEACRLHAIRLPSLSTANAPSIESCEPHVPTGGIGVWKGDVVWSGFGYRTVQVVLSHEDLTRQLGLHGRRTTGGYRARQAVALAGGRYGILAEASRAASGQVFLVVRTGRIERVVATDVGETDSLRPSPNGRYLALLDPGGPDVRLFSAAGGIVPLPAVTSPHALAWSRDERWTALATRRSVYVFATKRPLGPVLRLPVRVRDLDWGA